MKNKSPHISDSKQQVDGKRQVTQRIKMSLWPLLRHQVVAYKPQMYNVI